MGLFGAFRRSAKPAVTPTDTRATGGFTVIDVETTGLSARQHRVLELAVVRTDSSGQVLGEWVQRFDPEGPVGASHIHGITEKDVKGQPRFAQAIPDLNAWLSGTVVVAHNARFDLAFLASEYRYAGWQLPTLPTLCTLDASQHYLPQMDRRRLSDCCHAAGLPLVGAHSALGDARATAKLLSFYLDPQRGLAPRKEHLELFHAVSGVVWPEGPALRPQTPAGRAHTAKRIELKLREAPPAALVSLLAGFSLIDALDEGAPSGSLAYLEQLAEALEDGEITEEEAAALDDLSAAHELSDDDRAAADRALVLALAHLALDDGKVTRAERTELARVSELLHLPSDVVSEVLADAERARLERLQLGLRALPTNWPHGDPLRVNDKVAFTGCDDTVRAQLEALAVARGVRVMGNVSSKTAMLVSDGGFTGGKAEAAARVGCRVVHPDVFALMLEHLQPAVRHDRPRVPRTTAESRPTTGIDPAHTELASSADPAVVRQWARDNGYAVGTRGRLPAELFAAFAASGEGPSLN